MGIHRGGVLLRRFFCGEETKEVPEKWCCFGQFLFLSLKQNHTYRFEVSSVDKNVC